MAKKTFLTLEDFKTYFNLFCCIYGIGTLGMPGNFARGGPAIAVSAMAFMAFANIYSSIFMSKVMLLAPRSINSHTREYLDTFYGVTLASTSSSCCSWSAKLAMKKSRDSLRVGSRFSSSHAVRGGRSSMSINVNTALSKSTDDVETEEGDMPMRGGLGVLSSTRTGGSIIVAQGAKNPGTGGISVRRAYFARSFGLKQSDERCVRIVS
ncbi:hypothetical protein PsorP6_011468 [Peronosclerospora sorghi]|uniref:Uncharacterized protein n=1 Tax=Peronosclerospora sorghi TaxID=230839 RepID=A0ACC0WMI8_9STRA|nr:hypothetical protein PsorP6_011468 [Peronosclerospora sorghi]